MTGGQRKHQVGGRLLRKEKKEDPERGEESMLEENSKRQTQMEKNGPRILSGHGSNEKREETRLKNKSVNKSTQICYLFFIFVE